MDTLKIGCVYKIYNINNLNLCYVGSTFKTIEHRLNKHKSIFKQ